MLGRRRPDGSESSWDPNSVAGILSPAIVEEVLRALAYPKVRKHVRGNVDPELSFEDIVMLAQLTSGEYEVHGVSEDPDDDKYIAAAVEGHAVFVVSDDPDVLAINEHEGLRFVRPRAFLAHLEHFQK